MGEGAPKGRCERSGQPPRCSLADPLGRCGLSARAQSDAWAQRRRLLPSRRWLQARSSSAASFLRTDFSRGHRRAQPVGCWLVGPTIGSVGTTIGRGKPQVTSQHGPASSLLSPAICPGVSLTCACVSCAQISAPAPGRADLTAPSTARLVGNTLRCPVPTSQPRVPYACGMRMCRACAASVCFQPRRWPLLCPAALWPACLQSHRRWQHASVARTVRRGDAAQREICAIVRA